MGLVTGLLLAGAGLSAAGTIQQGRVAKAQAKGEQAMAEYNAKVSEQSAKAVEMKTAFDQQRQAKFSQRVLGTLRARLGGSGAATYEGAPVEAVSEQASELSLENALIGYEGQIEAGRFRSQGTLYGMEGKIAGMRAKNAMTGAYLSAGGTLLTGLGTAKYAGMMVGKGTQYNLMNPATGTRGTISQKQINQWLSTP